MTEQEIQLAMGTLKDLNALLPAHKQLVLDMKNVGDVLAAQQKILDELRLAQLARTVERPARKGEVSRAAAESIGARVLLEGVIKGGFTFREESQKELLVGQARGFLGIQAKTTLSSSDIPQLTEYMTEVAELIPDYGIGRLITTGFPMMADTVNFPRAGVKPAFAYYGSAAAISELSPTLVQVAFQAKKFGGIVRYAREIEAGSIAAFGQFITKFGAMEFARTEDDAIFNADGTTTYGPATSLTGFRTLVDTAATRQVLGAGLTSNTDATLEALRAVRKKVAAAAMRRGAYYFHPTFEGVLSALNTDDDKPYRTTGAKTAEMLIGRAPAAVLSDATFDGFPIVWVDVMPPASDDAAVSQVFGLFGDASYMYLGTRMAPEVAISEHAYWTTDEIGIRFLARHSINSMVEQAANKAAMAGIKTAAA
jgi:HK97 family phage major capsid protein